MLKLKLSSLRVMNKCVDVIIMLVFVLCKEKDCNVSDDMLSTLKDKLND